MDFSAATPETYNAMYAILGSGLIWAVLSNILAMSAFKGHPYVSMFVSAFISFFILIGFGLAMGMGS